MARKLYLRNLPDAGQGSGQIVVEKPRWDDRTGELTWRGGLVLRLATHAHAERALLGGFQRVGWIWVIVNPIDQAQIGDPTQETRHAIHYLNKHQHPQVRMHFFSLHGNLVGWCDASWIPAIPPSDDRSGSQ